jgi:hypothetical protein
MTLTLASPPPPNPLQTKRTMTAIGVHVGYQTTAFAAPRGGGIDVLLNDYSSRQTP